MASPNNPQKQYVNIGFEDVGGLDTSLPVSAADPLPVTSATYALQLDEVDAVTTYVGEALPGTLVSAAAWRIKKLTTTGADLAISWADGNAQFDNVWDDRAGLSYS